MTLVHSNYPSPMIQSISPSSPSFIIDYSAIVLFSCIASITILRFSSERLWNIIDFKSKFFMKLKDFQLFLMTLGLNQAFLLYYPKTSALMPLLLFFFPSYFFFFRSATFLLKASSSSLFSQFSSECSEQDYSTLILFDLRDSK